MTMSAARVAMLRSRGLSLLSSQTSEYSGSPMRAVNSGVNARAACRRDRLSSNYMVTMDIVLPSLDSSKLRNGIMVYMKAHSPQFATSDPDATFA
jgi:hypothetical protein